MTPRRSRPYAFRVATFCCASVAPGNFPPALSRRGHRRATFLLALSGVCRSLAPAPSSLDTVLGANRFMTTTALSRRIRSVAPVPVLRAAGSAQVVLTI
jgi:hypothetical protein